MDYVHKDVDSTPPKPNFYFLTLFNIYTRDLRYEEGGKLIYVDDIAGTAQVKTIKAAEEILNSDLKAKEKYFLNWRLEPYGSFPS